MILRRLRRKSCQSRDLRHILQDPAHITEIKICGNLLPLREILVYLHLFHILIAFDHFQLFPADLSGEPPLPAPLLQTDPFYLILPKIIKQPNQQSQKQRREKRRQKNRSAGKDFSFYRTCEILPSHMPTPAFCR